MRRIAAILLLALSLCHGALGQTDVWTPGVIGTQVSINCSIVGNPQAQNIVQSYAAWLHRADLSAPQTGDVSYVGLVMSVPGLACAPDSAVAVLPVLHLPPGATLAVSPTTPVRCHYQLQPSSQPAPRITGTQIGINGVAGRRVGPVCPDGLGGGVGTPFLVGSVQAPGGGLSLGPQVLVRSTYLEIQVPLRFARALSVATDRVRFDTVGLDSGDAAIWDGFNGTNFVGDQVATHEVAISVPYRPLFTNLASMSIGAGAARVSGSLSNFYVGGSVFVDHGPGTSYGSSVAVGNVSSAAESHTLTQDLVGLPPASTVHWRFRFVASNGTTYLGPDQTVTTAGMPAQTLTVVRSGNGGGTVGSLPAGINCGNVCTGSFPAGTAVTLTATAAPGSAFAGWGGACSGTGPCNLVLNAATQVDARFNLAPTTPQTLSIARQGAGTVTSSPAGIDCGATCSATFPPGSRVTLAATPAIDWVFERFVGCSGVVGASTCFVTMDQVRNVTALFRSGRSYGSLAMSVTGLPANTLAPLLIEGPDGFSLQRSQPTGTGSSLSDVRQGGYSVIAPSVVVAGTTYTANPARHNLAVGAGTSSAPFSFAAAPAGTRALTVTRAGMGSGTVSSLPAGIACGSTCSASFARDAQVLLQATATAGSDFAGWSGACSGSTSCLVTMAAARSVTANFVQAAPRLAVRATIGATPPPPSPPKGSTNVALLAFTLDPSQPTLLQQVVVQASGSGRDHLDLTAVRLVADANGNGVVDAGEPVLASGRFSADDGTLTLALNPSRPLQPGAGAFVIAVDLNTVLATAAPALGPALALALPALLWPRRRWRRAALVVAVPLALGSCSLLLPLPGSGFQLSLTAVGASAMPTVSGLPLTGPMIAVRP